MEGLGAEDYLNLSYYHKWLKVLEKSLLAKGFLIIEELEAKTEALAADHRADVLRWKTLPSKKQLRASSIPITTRIKTSVSCPRSRSVTA